MKRTAIQFVGFGLLLCLVASATGCSQSTAHPTPLGDCKIAGCNQDLGQPYGAGTEPPAPAKVGDGGGSTGGDSGGGSTDAATD